MTEPPDIEEAARKEQVVEDLWGDGERDIDAIAAKVGLPLPEVRRVLVRAGVTTWEGDDAIVRLSELGADDFGKTYLFDLEVVAIDGPMLLPISATLECLRCGAKLSLSIDPLEFALSRERDVARKMLECDKGQGGCGRSAASTKFKSLDEEEINYHVLTVADIQDGASFAEGYDDRRLLVHLLRAKAPLGSRIRLRAQVIREPKTLDIQLVSEDYREKEGRPAAPVMDADTVANLTRVGTMPIEVLRGQMAPDMVGRPLAQEARLLTVCSPTRILDVNGKEIRGTLYEALIGDTATNKSESALDTARAQGFGPYIQAENAARTGLTYTITERAKGGWHLEWGTLVRNHGKYAVLDGVEKWSSEMQGQLRGVLNDQEVEVQRVVHGRRPCAVRLTITANPGGRDGGKDSEKSIREYAYRCMAIPDTRPFTHGPDIRRIDLWLTFAKEDVPENEITRRTAPARPVDPDLFRTLVFWAWSRKPENVRYLPDAAERIRTESAVLMREYGCSSLPIAHPGLRDTVCRVSAAFAVLSFSSLAPTYEDIVVSDAHVARAVGFLRRVYDAIELGAYKKDVEDGLMLSGGVCIDIARAIGSEGDMILCRLLRGPKASEEIATELDKWNPKRGFTEDVVRKQYADLREHGLIETRPGKGASLTGRGAQYLRFLRTADKFFVPNPAQSPNLRAENGTKNLDAQTTDEMPPLEGDGGAGPQEAT